MPSSAVPPAVPYTLALLDLTNDSHLAQVVALVNLCYRGDGSWTGEKGIVSGLRTTLPSLLSDLRAPGAEMLLALSAADDVLACVKTGAAAATVVGPLTGPPAAYLGMLAVQPQLQSGGMGGAMIRAVEERAAAVHRCERVVLDVLSCREKLIRWYKRLGYVSTENTTPAAPFMRNKGEELLVDCSFIVFEKKL